MPGIITSFYDKFFMTYFPLKAALSIEDPGVAMDLTILIQIYSINYYLAFPIHKYY